MRKSKIIVVFITVLSVSLCDQNEEAVEFMRILIRNSEEGKSEVNYWAEKISEVAEHHPKQAESVATMHDYFMFIKDRIDQIEMILKKILT